MICVDELHIYPVKSLPGLAVDCLQMTARGPQNDRVMMLIDDQNRMLTQRSCGVLSQFAVELVTGGWQFTAPQGGVVVVDESARVGEVLLSSVWKSVVEVQEMSSEVSQWFSQQLQQPVKLVALSAGFSRGIDVQGQDSKLHFADKYPLLLCNQQSLQQLNQQLGRTLIMARFRPNIVVSIEAGAEFQLAKLRHSSGGALVFGEPCKRCNIPAIDPATGVFDKQLHQQLSAHLMRENRVLFGVNGALQQLSELKIGDQLQPY